MKVIVRSGRLKATGRIRAELTASQQVKRQWTTCSKISRKDKTAHAAVQPFHDLLMHFRKTL